MLDTAAQSNRITGIVFDIKRFAVHDGPGIRSTVFLKGCPLRCVWCHNPHSQVKGREVSFHADLCRYCGQCVDLCPEGCHEVGPDLHDYNRRNCVLCGECMSACLPGALKFIGLQQTVDQVIEQVLKDEKYYQNSGGGMTVSGGEPMAQFAFTNALLRAAKARGLHTVLDTCGQAPFENYAQLMPFVDLVHYDIKESDTQLHKKYTGVGLELIIENLYRLDGLDTPIILRCPIIPGLNDRPEHFRELAAIAARCKNVTAIHIMPFHPYGNSHAMKIGMALQLQSVQPPGDEQVDKWIEQISELTELPVSRG